MGVLPGRFSQIRWLQNVAGVFCAVAAVLLVGAGIVRCASAGTANGIWMIVAGGGALYLAVMLMTFSPVLMKMESTLARQLEVMRDLEETLQRHVATLERVAENTRLSDAAKSLAHREQELDELRAAIREDIRASKWEAALYLVDEIERRFGYREEAEHLRDEVDEARSHAIEAKLQEAVDMIESHFQSREWERAQREIDRLFNALPDSPRILALRDRMRSLKEAHKEELKLAWAEAVRRNDTDRAIDVLKELDQYMSSAEAQELQDSARNVFKEKLLRLGVQFRFAVTEKRWNDALQIGLDLIREFPNARMANEVREVLDMLRERARTGTAGTPAETAPESQA